ncbi:MAG TPA: hypothetical protein VFF73_05345 [Planctomycetota bacterium]|nr:hypothetical protein [Planctomycetota bacterium]
MNPGVVGLAVLVPAFVAGAALLLRRPFAGAWGFALAVVAGIVVLFHATLAEAIVPRLALVAILAAVAGSVGKREGLRLGLLALASIAGPAVVLQVVPAETLSLKEKLVWGGAEALSIFAITAAVDLRAKTLEGPGLPILLWVVASGGALALADGGGDEKGGLLGASVAGALGALGVLSFVLPTPGAGRAAAPVVTTVLGSLWVFGYHLAYLPLAAGVVLLAAPALVWSGVIVKKRQALLAAPAIVAATAVAVWLSPPWELLKEMGFKKPGSSASSSAEGE